MRLLSKLIRSSIFTIHLVFMVLLVLSAYSVYISPQKAVIFSFLGMGFPALVVINLLFTAWWLLFMQWKKLLVGLAVLALCYSAIHTYFPLNKSKQDIPKESIKVLTYNVMGYEYTKAHSGNKINQVVQYIADSQADIVCIQEHRTLNNKVHLSPKQLNKALSMYPHRCFHPIYTPGQGTENYGLSIYSKYPILSSEKISFESEYNGAVKAKLSINGKEALLINCHLETNNLSSEDRETYEKMVDEFDSKNLHIVANLTFNKLKPAFQLRAKQAEKIAALIKNATEPYIIVCGDFNDTPISYARNTIKGQLKDAFVESGFGPGITYNQNKFYFRIDYIFHSQNIQSYQTSVGKLKNSDHYPVYTWLQLK